MKILGSYQDYEYPYKGIYESRNIARAILMNEEGKFYFHHLFGNDLFGHRDYYETPGGGVEKGETLEEAIRRECLEETGYHIDIIAPIGEVIDYYNLIHRKNLNHYFLVKVKGARNPTHFVSKGDFWIQETVPFSLCEAERQYEAKAITPLARLLLQREKPIIEETRKLLESFLFLASSGKNH